MISALKCSVIFLAAMFIFSCKKTAPLETPTTLESPFSVVHLEPQGNIFEDAPYPHMWYYRTEVRNNSDRELRIVWFESYIEVDGIWYPGNALGRTLRSNEFSEWYTESNEISNGILLPGSVASCDVNWHGGPKADHLRIKWAYIAVDKFGFDYFIEAEVEADILKYVDYSTKSIPRK